MALLQPGPRAGGYFGKEERLVPLIRGRAAHTGHMLITTCLGSCCCRHQNVSTPPHRALKRNCWNKNKEEKVTDTCCIGVGRTNEGSEPPRHDFTEVLIAKSLSLGDHRGCPSSILNIYADGQMALCCSTGRHI